MFVYGLGQILGPVVAQGLFAVTKGFDAPLLVSAGSLVLGGMVVMLSATTAVVRDVKAEG